MDQIARVIQILDGGVAVVEASRKDACDMRQFSQQVKR
jgi:hypothetical protein